MKQLNGSEIAGFIKERQSKTVRRLKQSEGIHPKLAIVKTIDNPIINTYVRLKHEYGNDIGVEVEVFDVPQDEAPELIGNLNDDESVTGIIVQLPVADNNSVGDLLNKVAVDKDVDGLAEGTSFTPATPLAITWLLDGYNINLVGRDIAQVGRGRLVGGPLERELTARGLEVRVYEYGVTDLAEKLQSADVVISATGTPGLITAEMLKQGAVAVDAGVATEDYKQVGDFADDVYEREDITVTPKKGGVGPLTVCALFENLLRAASL